MNLQEMVTELERRCPGCAFDTEMVNYIEIVEFGKKLVVDLEKVGYTAEEWFEFEIARHPSPEKYRVRCPRCGVVVIGYGNYIEQMHRADQFWYCPQCGSQAAFDDENYDTYLETELSKLEEQDT